MESNKLIAEFMGYAIGSPHQTDKYGYDQCEDGFEIPHIINHYRHDADINSHQFLIEQLQFHNSWDWLMPVVVKIWSMGWRFEIHQKHAAVGDYTKPFTLVIHKYDTPIENVYHSVVAFIEYYNQHPTN